MDITITRALLDIQSKISDLDRDIKMLEARLEWERQDLARRLEILSKPRRLFGGGIPQILVIKAIALIALMAAQIPIKDAISFLN